MRPPERAEEFYVRRRKKISEIAVRVRMRKADSSLRSE